jgi:hypothetical protein
MIYALYLLLIPVSLILTLVAIILAPVLPLLASEQAGWLDNHAKWGVGPRLPTWLAWFQTPDNSLDGDATFERLNGISYWAKVKWLWRNPCYAFAIRYLTNPYHTVVKGNTSIKDNDNAKEGWCLVTANGLFQFRLVCRIFSTNRCLYINFGWNVIGLVDPNVKFKPDPWQATFVFSPRISGFR